MAQDNAKNGQSSGQSGDSGTGGSTGDGAGFFGGIYNRYIDNANGFDNLATDIPELFSRITDFSWIGSLFDFDLPLIGGLFGNVTGLVGGIFGDGIIGFLLTLIVILAVVATVAVFTLAMVMHTLIYTYRILRYFLWKEPGEMNLGYVVREGTTKRARLARIIFPMKVLRQCYDDTLRHWEIVGPTGGGKTVFLTNMIRQNLAAGVTTVVIELDGSLGARARRYAELYERDVITLDATHEDTGYWNPMVGADKDIVAEQMVNLVASDYVTQQFFKDIAIVLTRHAVIAVKSYEERYGAEANINQLIKFISSRTYRDEVLVIESSKETGVKVTAPWIPEYTRRWFEMIYFGQWDSDTRDKYTSGLSNVLEVVTGNTMLRRVITPPPAGGSPDAPKHPVVIEGAIESGGLVILRMPMDPLGTAAAVSAAGWVTQRLESATQARKSKAPLSVYMDEAHLILGKENMSIAETFRHWLPICRNYGVSLKLSYQSFEMIEYTLRAVIQGNARSKFIPGGVSPDDADKAERIAGDRDTVVEETRRTRRQFIPGGVLSSLGQSVTTGTKEGTEAVYSSHRVRNLPVGTWLVRAIDHNKLMPACLMYTPFKGKRYLRLEAFCIRNSVRLREGYEELGARMEKGAGRLAAPMVAKLQQRRSRREENKRLKKMEKEAQRRSQGQY